MNGRQTKSTSRTRPSPRLVKILRSYTVEEVAKLFGNHKNTVRSWLRAGLKTNDNQRPILILGRDLSQFLTDRRGKAKRKCAPGELYCLRCRSPKAAAGQMADYVAITPILGNLIAICPDCDLIMNRRVSRERLQLVCGELTITFEQASPQVNESQEPTVNSDFKGGGQG